MKHPCMFEENDLINTITSYFYEKKHAKSEMSG